MGPEMQVWKLGGSLVVCVVMERGCKGECRVRCSLYGLVLQPDTQKCFVETKYTAYKEILHTTCPQRMKALTTVPSTVLHTVAIIKCTPNFASN